jgi:signal transduction histidine kinase
MHLSVNPFALILLVSGLATIIMTLIIFKRLKQSERSFALVLGLAGWWALTYGGELSSTTFSTMFFWLKLEYIAICFLPPALLFFIHVFISSQKLVIKPLHALILVIPILTISLVWTNDVNHFYYKSITIDRQTAFPLLKIEPSFWYYIFTAYWYVTILWAVYSLLTAFKKADKIYKKQKNIILYALIVPWVCNMLYKLGINPHQNIDLTPFAFIVTAILISFGLLRYKLLNVIPAAREKIFESMHEGVLVLDTTNTVIDKNLRMEEILPSCDQEIIGLHLAELFPGYEELIEGVGERKKNTFEIKIVHNNFEKYYSVDISVLLNKTSDYNGCILIFHDITQSKTDALVLASHSKLKDRLFTIIAHDLRSPLINITDMVRMIDEQVITEEEFKLFLPDLSKNLNYTLSLLDNLLHWSKSQLKGEAVKPVVVDILNIVQHEIVYYSQKAAEKGIELNNALKAETLVHVDAEMIHLIIRNLIGNAIKFCTKGDNITVSSTINATNEVVICLADTGSGMKPETVERLFMPDTFTTRGTNNEQGTGLGLQLCKDFVEKNNGKIWVVTEWGKGSKFYFTVPAAASHPVLNRVI